MLAGVDVTITNHMMDRWWHSVTADQRMLVFERTASCGVHGSQWCTGKRIQFYVFVAYPITNIQFYEQQFNFWVQMFLWC